MSIGNPGSTGGSEISNMLVAGFKAAKENRREEAYNIFCDVVRRDPNNELGWLYRAATTDDLSEAYVCLQRVLSINPNSEKAQRGIERIQSRLESGETSPEAAVPANNNPAPPPPPAPPRFGNEEVVSGFNPPPASGSQATARFPYEENLGRPGPGSQLPDMPPSAAPPPYRPEFDNDNQGNFNDFASYASSQGMMNQSDDYDQSDYANLSPEDVNSANRRGLYDAPDASQPRGFYNTPEAPEPPRYDDDSELVDEPFETTGTARNRTQERLRSGRVGDVPTGTRSRGLAPVFGGISRGRRAAFGAETATGLDDTGRDRARRLMLPLIIAGVILAVLLVGLVVLGVLGNNNQNNQQAIDTAAAGPTVQVGSPTFNPTPLVVGTNPVGGTGQTTVGGPAASVPVVGGNPTTRAVGSSPVATVATTQAPTSPVTTAIAVQPAPTTAAPPPATTAAPIVPPGSATPRAVVYTVKSGDNLTRIAAQFSTTIAAIQAANRNVTGTNIFAGNQLVIPVSRGDFRGKGGAILQPNETLQTIADRYKVAVDELARFNGLAAAGDAKPGDAILVP